MNNFKQQGDTNSVIAPGAVSAGDLVQVGQKVGVAIHDAASGAALEIKRTGIFDLPAVSGETWTDGQPAYYDGTDISNVATSGNVMVGFVDGAKASGVVLSEVLLDGVARIDLA